MPNPQVDMMSEDFLKFKADPIRAQITDVSCTYDTEIFDELVSKQAAQNKFGEAIGSTANPQDPDGECELFEGTETIEFIASETHAENSYGVTAEMLEKVWQIDHDSAERTIRTTTQLSRQDRNTSISRNFYTNDRMHRYRRIRSLFYSDTLFVTGKARSAHGYTCM